MPSENNNLLSPPKTCWRKTKSSHGLVATSSMVNRRPWDPYATQQKLTSLEPFPIHPPVLFFKTTCFFAWLFCFSILESSYDSLDNLTNNQDTLFKPKNTWLKVNLRVPPLCHVYPQEIAGLIKGLFPWWLKVFIIPFFNVKTYIFLVENGWFCRLSAKGSSDRPRSWFPKNHGVQ